MIRPAADSARQRYYLAIGVPGARVIVLGMAGNPARCSEV